MSKGCYADTDARDGDAAQRGGETQRQKHRDAEARRVRHGYRYAVPLP